MDDKKGLLDSLLNNLKVPALTEMQSTAIKTISETDNTILLSDTGSGKTFAFLIPLIMMMDAQKRRTQAIIVVPSRELAIQIEGVFKSMGTKFKISCCYGGHKRETEENNLREAPALLVGTPGRLCDHIRRGSISTETIESIVFDEFDKSLELGFRDEMEFIIKSLKAIKKRILTSATPGVDLPSFIGLENPVTLNFLSGAAPSANKLAIQFLMSDGKDKLDTLFRLICMIGNRSAIVFCNHRESVERTSNLLKEKDIVNVFYHGAMEQQERDAALSKFRNGTSNVLVTTDLASRGLDIAHIRYIIHYHQPGTEDIFTHRNGRTARMDASGTVILILSPEEKLPEYIKTDVEQIELPETIALPEKPKWTTLFIAAGKKDKVNKIDIVGFLSNKGLLKKDEIGLIDVKDFFSFVSVKKSKASHTLQLIKDQKIKNKKVKIAVAK